jgi:hypothetical protein
MLRTIRGADAAINAAVSRGTSIEEVDAVPSLAALARMRGWLPETAQASAESVLERIERDLEETG